MPLTAQHRANTKPIKDTAMKNEIIALLNAGKTVAQVAKELKAQGVTKEQVLAIQVELKQAAQVQANPAPVAKADKPQIDKPQIDKTKRDLVQIFSPSCKTAFLTTNILYANKSVEAIVELAKKDLSKKPKLVEMLAAEDLQAVHLEKQYGETEAEVKKAAAHAKLIQDGYKMGSTCPRVAPAPVQAAPVETTEAEAQPA